MQAHRLLAAIHIPLAQVHPFADFMAPKQTARRLSLAAGVRDAHVALDTHHERDALLFEPTQEGAPAELAVAAKIRDAPRAEGMQVARKQGLAFVERGVAGFTE